MEFWRNKHVVITGGGGFLGSAIVRKLRNYPVARVTAARRAELDLRKAEDISKLFAAVADPAETVVIHAAARVGGIGANSRQPATYFYDNALMGIQLIDAAVRRHIAKFITIGTVCAYPKDAALPFREADLSDGYPEKSNAAYGLAKKMLLVQGQAYRAELGFNSVYLLPTNLYGPEDHFDLEDSHVIPALIRKCVQARERRESSITAWGSGAATRDYLFVDDAAEAILLAAERYDGAEPVNISGETGEISVRELAVLICRLTGYAGDVVWDRSRPDGQRRRQVDGRRARELFGFVPHVNFEDGLQRTIAWFEQHRAA